MAQLTATPDDLVTSADLTRRDADLLDEVRALLPGAGRRTGLGVGGGQPALTAAAEAFLHTEAVVVSALSDAARILSEGFAGAAEDYRDAEIRISAGFRRGSW